jgi:hypothetical protein
MFGVIVFFYDLLTRHSGFFGHGDMQKEFEEAAFALQPGEISDIVESQSGLHLIERYADYYSGWYKANYLDLHRIQ